MVTGGRNIPGQHLWHYMDTLSLAGIVGIVILVIVAITTGETGREEYPKHRVGRHKKFRGW